MPHKRNPVLTENLTGLARLVRSAVVPALEDVALWHERDISHSSVERGIGPDATVHLDFALRRLAGVVERLVIYPENMQKNLDRAGRAGAFPARAAGPDPEGHGREAAYAAVQRNAMKVWRGEGRFLDLLKADPESVRFSRTPNWATVRPRLPLQGGGSGVRAGVRGLVDRTL